MSEVENEVDATNDAEVVAEVEILHSVEWTKEFWKSVNDNQLPEVYRFSATALADSRKRSSAATERRAKFNSVARQVQPGRTVLVRKDGVPLMMKIFESASAANDFIRYEEGLIPRFTPSTNYDPKTKKDLPVKWTEVTRPCKSTHEILH